VRRLADKGLLDHRRGGTVRLTAAGRRVAGEILHLHEDLVLFLTEILGLSEAVALQDACQLEHGCSRQTAQRLHEFLEFFEALPEKDKQPFVDFTSQKRRSTTKFRNLPGNKVHGWRS
jgi:DtxR family Mn-dependent transcriptional regulator